MVQETNFGKKEKLIMRKSYFFLLLFSLFFPNNEILAIESDMTIDVQEGADEAVPPLFGEDPVDPNQGTQSKGVLKLDRVPNIKFMDVIPSSIVAKNISAKNTNPYIQISDVRGTLAGWTLYGKVSRFTSYSGDVLLGARLALESEAILKPSDVGTEAIAPTGLNSVLNESESKLAYANINEGQGTWGIKWNNINLKILPKTAKENTTYQAEITWVLYDGPN